MKESEAKTKWCPMAANNNDNTDIRCIGSDCMMWEPWEYESATDTHSPVTTKNKGEGDCGLKTKELQCNV